LYIDKRFSLWYFLKTMNEQERQQKKDSLLKSIAIIGFISTVILIAWLSVKLVGLAPNAFSSLASLAETLNERRLDLVSTDENTWSLKVVSDTTLTTAASPVTITWEAAETAGNFTFSYACKEGIAVDLIDVADLGSIACNTEYSLGTATAVTFSVDSEKERYTDLAYTISFVGNNDTSPRATETMQLTVVNNVINTDQDNSVAIEAPEETTTAPKPITTETPATPVIPTPEVVAENTPSTVTPPLYTEEVIYVTPVSDPNGRTDLGVRFVGTGTIANNSFMPGVVSQNKAGAIQFEVKNYGTKTSGTWNISVNLPDGSLYESKAEAALKPNERAVMTIGFLAVAVATHTFIVTASEANDNYVLNDSLQQTVRFAN